MYDTWVILQYSLYTVAVSGEMTNVHSLVFSLPLLHPIHSSAYVLMSVNRLFSVRRGRRRVCSRFRHWKHIVAVVLLDACSRAQSAGICCCRCKKHVRGAREALLKLTQNSTLVLTRCRICRRVPAECYKSVLSDVLQSEQ